MPEPLPLVKKRRGRRPGVGNSGGPNKTYRNFTLDSDILEDLHTFCNQMEAELGFRPTLSQAVRVMLKRALKKENPE